MPLDGAWDPHYNGWTIRVEPSRRVAAQWMGWSEQRRDAYNQLAADVAYGAITAIQGRFLRKRRVPRWRPSAWVFYFFRQHERRARTILITIYKVEFHDPDCDPDPDPKPGAAAPRPLDPLVLDVSGAGRLYTVDRVRSGVLPLPSREDINPAFSTTYAQYAMDNAQISPHVIIGYSRYHFLKPFRIVEDLASPTAWLRLHAARTPSAKLASWEMRKSFQCDIAPSIGRAPGPVATIYCATERFAQNPGKDADITTGVIHAADAQYGFLLPNLAFRSSSEICTQQIHPSGLS